MKTIVKASMLFASAMVMFSSCLKEQTTLEIEDIPGVAKVMGVLTYSEGQAYEGGQFVELKKPAANVELIVKVDNASLSPNGQASGTTDYSTMTKEDGSFEVIIPAVDRGVSYTLFAPSFQGVCNTLSDKCIKDGEIIFDKKEGVFELSREGASPLQPGSVDVVNASYSFKAFAEEKYLSTHVSLIVEAGIGICTKEKVEVYDGETIYQPSATLEYASGVDVVVKVTYGEDYDNEVRYYGATTGNDGTAVMRIPATSEDMTANIEIFAKEFVGEDDFVYYTMNDEGDGVDNHEIVGGLYTFSQFSTAGTGLRSFEFFIPIVSVTMTVNTIVSGADEDNLFNASDYYGFWDADELGKEE